MTQQGGCLSARPKEPGSSGQPVVVYGAGMAAERMLRAHGHKLGSVRFASTTGGGDFHGQPIMSAAALATLPEVEIVIASSFLTPILQTLRDHGISGQRIWWYFHGLDRFVHHDELGSTPSRGDVLHAFYDLAMNPSTYDAVIFAARADAERWRRGLKYLHFVIVPSLITGGRPGDLELLGGAENIVWRQNYILSAVFKLVPSTRGVTQLASREEADGLANSAAQRFPTGYNTTNPTDEHILKHCYGDKRDGFDPRVLRAPEKARKFIEQFLSSRQQGRKLLVLTLREYPFQPDRNNDFAAWGAFLAELDLAEYFIVIIRDTDCIYQPMPAPLADYEDFPLASIDAAFRLALYEAAYLNLTVTTGPAGLLYFSSVARYLMFKQHLPQYEATGKEFQLTRNGMNIGDTFPLAGPFQKFIWEPDTQDVIRREFDAMISRLEAESENAMIENVPVLVSENHEKLNNFTIN